MRTAANIETTAAWEWRATGTTWRIHHTGGNRLRPRRDDRAGGRARRGPLVAVPARERGRARERLGRPARFRLACDARPRRGVRPLDPLDGRRLPAARRRRAGRVGLPSQPGRPQGVRRVQPGPAPAGGPPPGRPCPANGADPGRHEARPRRDRKELDGVPGRGARARTVRRPRDPRRRGRRPRRGSRPAPCGGRRPSRPPRTADRPGLGRTRDRGSPRPASAGAVGGTATAGRPTT